jgi:cytosine/adenosine deaminase-related metal-dependent hydrolase/ubiquinone/menaquinone biosynthesis C-methylase UbiE
MSSTLPTAAISPQDAYRVWARTYDTEANPMLSLEQRFLGSILPDMKGLDVLDLGCGTGRWLAAVKDSGARTLLGIDSSPAMLQAAKTKLGTAATLVNANCETAFLSKASADLIICSFLLSYLEDAASFLKKVRAILRPGGSAFVTDLHPETVTRLHWRRGVHLADGFHEIRTVQPTLAEIIRFCGEADLDSKLCLQPGFGEPERLIFQTAGKQLYFEEIKKHPAIYILQLQAGQSPRNTSRDTPRPNAIGTIRGAALAFGAQSVAQADLNCANSRITSVRDPYGIPPLNSCQDTGLNLTGFLVLPGLVNPHDHLEFALYPRLGKSNYKNFLEWADDIHRPDFSPVREHRQVPREARLWWGGIRNLLCGVTTVCHHNPYEPAVFEDDFIVRVLCEYGWAHSLPMDPDVGTKKQKTPKGQPFLLHLGEGIDERSAAEIFELHQASALDEDTVLIHGLALKKPGRALLRSARAGLVWCPSSNIFLFGETLSSSDLQEIPRLALGSDSPLTAEGDLLDELRFAHEFIGAPAEDLYSCVLRGSADLLRLKNGEGTLRVGAHADLIAVRDTGMSPAGTLATLSHSGVELVLLGGCVQLASGEMIKRLPPAATQGLQPLCVEGTVRWIRAPLRWLFAQTTPHLGDEIRLGGKRVSLAN